MMFNLRPNHRKSKLFLLIPLLLMAASTGVGQTNTFTYQGRLTDGGTPATGIYDMQFKLYDAPTGGSQQPPAPGGPITITNATVTVTNGVFTVQLDFGSGAFPGGPSPTGDRYLEIAMRHPNDAAYTTLSPRQQITSTPYAIRSSSAQAADNATQLATQLSSAGTINTSSNPVDWTELKNVPSFVNGGYSAGNGISITGTTLSNTGVLTVDASGPLSSSGGPNPNIALSGVVPVANGGTGTTTQNFVDLSTNQSILGNKTFTSAVNTSTQYNIGGQKVLSVAGGSNLFAGVAAGQINTGSNNSFFGNFAGASNTIASNNSLFGNNAGSNNTEGHDNAFFGFDAGLGDANNPSVGSGNSFFGSQAGQSNSTGDNNSFFGYFAGQNNTAGNDNAFFGSAAGLGDPNNPNLGSHNAFFGSAAGASNTESNNSFFGYFAGEGNTTGRGNTFIGSDSGTNNQTGNGNIAIGWLAGHSMSEDNSNNIYIDSLGANESHTIRIGYNQTTTFIAGINGVNVGPAVQVFVNANGQLGTVASSRRFKENIRDMGANSGDLLRLRPVTFLYKTEYSQGPRTLQYGLIAEEVAKVNPNLVAYAKDGTPYTVQYHLLTPMLLNEVQKQHKLIQSQEQQIEGQAQLITDLSARLTRLETLAVHRKIFRPAQAHIRRRAVRSAP